METASAPSLIELEKEEETPIEINYESENLKLNYEVDYLKDYIEDHEELIIELNRKFKDKSKVYSFQI
jgi:hypothetical protein